MAIRRHAPQELPEYAMSPPSNSGSWQTLLELRRRREIIECWLANRSLTDDVRLILQAMLCETEDRLQLLSRTLLER